MKALTRKILIGLIVSCSFSFIKITSKKVENVMASDSQMTFGEIGEYIKMKNPDRQHFYVNFSESIGTQEKLYLDNPDPIIGNYSQNVCDHIHINGHSVSFINENGVNLRGESIKLGVTIHLSRDPSGKLGFHFFIDDNLAKEYGGISYKLRLDDTDEIVFKAGLSYENLNLTSDLTLRYYNSINDWKRSNPADLIDTRKNDIVMLSQPVYEPTQHVYYFYAETEYNCCDKFIGFATYKELTKNIYYYDRCIFDLAEEYGVENCYVRFQSRESMLIDGDGYLMYLTFGDDLVKDYPLNSNAIIRFKKELKFPSLSTLTNEQLFYFNFDNNYWVSKECETNEFDEVKLIDVSQPVFDSSSGAYYIVLYFDKDISFHYLPQVNAELDWLKLVYNLENPLFYYSQSFLEALAYDYIRISVLKYMFINDVSIFDLCNKDLNSDVIRFDQSIVVNYCGSSFDSKTIQILFNPNGSNKFDKTKDYTITLKKGYKTPLHSEIKEDISIKFNSTYIEENIEEKSFNILWVIIPVSALLLVSGITILTIVLTRRKHNEKK